MEASSSAMMASFSAFLRTPSAALSAAASLGHVQALRGQGIGA